MGKPPWEQPPSTFEDLSNEINDIHVHGKPDTLIPHDVINIIEDFYRKDAALWKLQVPMKPLTRRQRLRIKWSDFRWWLGHKIVGYECEEDDW